mgnify:CR=1 FL=1
MRPHSLQRTISFVSLFWFPLPLLPSAVLGEGGWHVAVHKGVHGSVWTLQQVFGRALHVMNMKFTLCFTYPCLSVFPLLMLLWCADHCACRFYQHQPSSAQWYWGLCWDHVVSDDLVHWKNLPPAVVPTPGGLDADGCFSGGWQDCATSAPLCACTAASVWHLAVLGAVFSSDQEHSGDALSSTIRCCGCKRCCCIWVPMQARFLNPL